MSALRTLLPEPPTPGPCSAALAERLAVCESRNLTGLARPRSIEPDPLELALDLLIEALA